MINTDITIITALYNINRERWQNSSRSMDKYFINCEHVLNKKNAMVIYTTEEYNERCKQIRMKTDPDMSYTKIINIPFENLFYFEFIEVIRQNQLNNINKIDIGDRVNPEFCIPDYIIVINNKIHFLKMISEQNPFHSTIFQWVDFGLHPNMYKHDSINFCPDYFNKISYIPNKIRVSSFIHPEEITNEDKFYNSHISTTAATLIAGDQDSIYELYDMWNYTFFSMMMNGFVNQEQYIIYHCMCSKPELFHYLILPNWDNLIDSFKG